MLQTIEDFKANFNEAIETLCRDKGNSTFLLTREQHNIIISRLIELMADGRLK